MFKSSIFVYVINHNSSMLNEPSTMCLCKFPKRLYLVFKHETARPDVKSEEHTDTQELLI